MMQTIDLPSEACEFKFADGNEWKFEGYASVFDSVDRMGDTVLPGAYKSCIETKGPAGIFMRYEHLRHTNPGKWVHMEEDSKGFLVAGELTKGHSLAGDIRASMQHENVGGLSIGWRPMNSVIERKSEGRTLRVVDVFEISFTRDPAEPKSEITSFKTMLDDVTELKDAERLLRESGVFTRSMATMFVGHFKSLIQSESEAAQREEMHELKKRLAKYEAGERLANYIKGL